MPRRVGADMPVLALDQSGRREPFELGLEARAARSMPSAVRRPSISVSARTLRCVELLAVGQGVGHAAM